MGKAGRIARVCLRLVLWGALTWIAFLLAIQGVLATESGQHWARKQVVAFLSEALHTEVTLESLRLSGLAHLALEGLVVYDKAGQPFLQTQTLEVHWNPLFSGGVSGEGGSTCRCLRCAWYVLRYTSTPSAPPA